MYSLSKFPSSSLVSGARSTNRTYRYKQWMTSQYDRCWNRLRTHCPGNSPPNHLKFTGSISNLRSDCRRYKAFAATLTKTSLTCILISFYHEALTLPLTSSKQSLSPLYVPLALLSTGLIRTTFTRC